MTIYLLVSYFLLLTTQSSYFLILVFYLLYLNRKIASKLVTFSCVLFLFIFLRFLLIINQPLITDQTIDFQVTEKIAIYDYSQSAIIKSQGQKFLLVDSNSTELLYGNKYTCNLDSSSAIESTFNNPSSFDKPKYYLSKQITSQLNTSNCTLLTSNKNPYYYFKNVSYKTSLKNKENYPLTSHYINALILGINDIDEQISKLYKNVGVIHLFAISGMHISLLANSLDKILKIFFKKHRKHILSILLIVYSVFAQNSFPVNRACFTKIITLYFPNITQDKIIFGLVGCNLIINPFCFLNIGFILTYSIASIFYYLQVINFNSKKQLFLVQILLLPIMINLNYTFNPFFIITNWLLIPVVSYILLPLSFLKTLFYLPVLDKLGYFLIEFMQTVAYVFDFATINIGNISPQLIVIYYLLFLLWFKQKIALKRLITGSLILLVLVISEISILGSVTFVDVGQAKAILIKFPLSSTQLLIDTGTEKYQNELQQYLAYHGINKLEHVVITHNHSDHFGGYPFLEQNFKIKNTYSSQSLDINIDNMQILQANDIVTINGYQFQVLAPSKIDTDPNLNSLVLYTMLNKTSWLFTGDTTQEIEKQILETYPLLEVDYLDVAHHGSSTSSSQDFIKQINPSFCYIQAGKNNIHNHPSPEILNTLSINNCSTYTTQELGAITVFF